MGHQEHGQAVQMDAKLVAQDISGVGELGRDLRGLQAGGPKARVSGHTLTIGS